MAVRPWVTPEDVKSYSDREKVQTRSDEKLKVDISRAEQYVIQYTQNRFDDAAKYPAIPTEVKTAVILIAEVYGNTAADGKGEFKSETFDDYSYTVADTAVKLENLDLASLLDEHIVETARGQNAVTMKLRKL